MDVTLKDKTPITIKPEPIVQTALSVRLAPRVPQLKTIAVSELSKFADILLIGGYGEGKTTLASTLLADDRITGVLYIDLERGSESIANVARQYPHKIRLVRPENLTKDMNSYFKYAREAVRTGLTEEDGFKLNAVVIDSVGEWSLRSINDVTKADAMIEAGELPSPAQIKDHWTNNAVIQQQIRNFRELPLHLVLTCRESEPTEDGKSAGKYHPLLPKQLAENVPGLFNEVLWLRSRIAKDERTGEKSRQFLLQCQPDAVRQAKNRTRPGSLPDIIVAPTMTKIFDYIFLPSTSLPSGTHVPTKEI